mmetsp:Transcript_81722/g.162649  ORF Transcript_81722/g.162649 Transcript_81722/m.162649 type:complete len:101 (-) Transcript_81722:37-339(-)
MRTQRQNRALPPLFMPPISFYPPTEPTRRTTSLAHSAGSDAAEVAAALSHAHHYTATQKFAQRVSRSPSARTQGDVSSRSAVSAVTWRYQHGSSYHNMSL